MKRSLLLVGAGVLVVALLAILIGVLLASRRPRSLPSSAQVLQGPKPTYNWYVCANLGTGSVPGVNGSRLRFRLCHDEGWELLAYCLQPRWPAPELNAACVRLDENTYWCGEGVQNLREYGLLQTPVPTPSPTLSLTPLPTLTATPSFATATATATPGPTLGTPTATSLTPSGPAATSTLPAATQPAAQRPSRPSPGGMGFLAWLGLVDFKPADFSQDYAPTPTPFQPQTQTPLPPEPDAARLSPTDIPATNGDAPPAGTGALSLNFYGIDFNDASRRIRIKIFPPDRQVNGGKPIVITFTPGASCEYGDRKACINAFHSTQGGETTYVTVHSGLGAEAEKLRHALEGTGFDRAWFSPQQVQKKLSALQGAEVVIVQGDVEVRGLRLVSVGRVPPQHLGAYMNAPLADALSLAASLSPSLANAVDNAQPQIIIETCGWKMPGEPWSPGVTSTSGSIYLGAIQMAP